MRKITRDDVMVCDWTEWYCPIKHCTKIVYNTKLGDRTAVDEHLKIEHQLMEI